MLRPWITVALVLAGCAGAPVSLDEAREHLLPPLVDGVTGRSEIESVFGAGEPFADGSVVAYRLVLVEKDLPLDRASLNAMTLRTRYRQLHHQVYGFDTVLGRSSGGVYRAPPPGGVSSSGRVTDRDDVRRWALREGRLLWVPRSRRSAMENLLRYAIAEYSLVVVYGDEDTLRQHRFSMVWP